MELGQLYNINEKNHACVPLFIYFALCISKNKKLG